MATAIVLLLSVDMAVSIFSLFAALCRGTPSRVPKGPKVFQRETLDLDFGAAQEVDL